MSFVRLKRLFIGYRKQQKQPLRYYLQNSMKRRKNIERMETGNTKRRLTASEQRFAKEMETLMKMSLTELLLVEKTRMPIGV